MVSQTIQKQLHQVLESMPVEKQQRVLDYARQLSNGLPPGTSGAALLQFAGTISAEDASLMRKAIEEECERIDPDGQ